MHTATLHLEDFAPLGGHGLCHVYALSEPHDGADYLAVVVYNAEGSGWQNKGVEVFGSDDTGWVPVLDTIYRSYLVESHVDVLARLGYTLTEAG